VTWILLAVGIWVVVFAAAFALPMVLDEEWFFVVVRRVRSRELLYRDVFYGAGPTPVWLACGAVKVAGLQFVVVRAVAAGVTAVTATAAAWMVREWGAGIIGVATACLITALSGCASRTDNLYGELTRCGVVLGLALVVAADGQNVPLSLAAGAAAAVALTSKYSAGAVGAVGIGGAVVAAATSAAVVVACAIGAIVVTALVLAPLFVQGTVRDAWNRLVVNKSVYLSQGSVGFRAGLRDLLTVPGASWRARVHRLALATAYAGLPIAGVALVAAVWLATIGEPAERVVVVCTLAVFWASLVWPRADAVHVHAALALPLVALILGVVALERANAIDGVYVDIVIGALFAWTLLLSLVVLLECVRCLRMPHDRGLPYCRWLPGDTRVRSEVLPSLQEIEAVAGRSVLLLGGYAPLWYLVSNLSNPTPYDIPAASVFGPHGQAQVVCQIQSGDIPWVASPEPVPGRLAPVELETFVFEHLTPVLTTPVATLFRFDGEPTRDDATPAAERVPDRRR
jgi:hypothetical protein